jgi:hypothetical protein
VAELRVSEWLEELRVDDVVEWYALHAHPKCPGNWRSDGF